MAHRCCQRAALPLKLAPSLLLLLLAVAAAQEIKLVAGPGCADLPPSPPTELKAVPGDGNVTLTFGRPSNGACVSEYQVTVLPVDASTTRPAPPPRQSTQQFSVTIAGLDNGQQYKFFVKAYAAKYRGGGEAQVVAAPIAACDPSALPLAPTALRATPGIANVTLCWAPAANGGCVDEWRVAIQAVQQSGQRATPAAYKRYNKGGCVTIAELTPGQLYTFSVQAYSAALKGGAYASVQATPLAPPKQWRCVPVPGQYPLCNAALAGRCAPLTCQQQVEAQGWARGGRIVCCRTPLLTPNHCAAPGLQFPSGLDCTNCLTSCANSSVLVQPLNPLQLAKGQCSAPFMRIVDPATATIIQHCADVCGCSADPAAGTATAARAMLDAMANATAAGSTTPVARRALRGTGAGATTQASSAALWASPSGCCAAPPRSFGAGDGEEGDGADSGL